MCPCWSRRSLGEDSVSLRVGYEVLGIQAKLGGSLSPSLFLLPSDPDVELKAVSHHALCLEDNRVNLGNFK